MLHDAGSGKRSLNMINIGMICVRTETIRRIMAVARRLIGYGKSDTLFLFTLDGQRFYVLY